MTSISVRLALLCLLLTGLLSCRQDPCVPGQESLAQVRVTLPGRGTATSQTLTAVTVLDQQVAGYVVQTPTYFSRSPGAYVLLPLNLNARQTRYTFRVRNRPDTLTLTYDVSTVFTNADCGYSVRLKRPAILPVAQSTVGTVQVAFSDERAFADTLYGFTLSSPSRLKIRLSL